MRQLKTAREMLVRSQACGIFPGSDPRVGEVSSGTNLGFLVILFYAFDKLHYQKH